MVKPDLKRICVAVVAIAAVTICIIGYQVTSSKQYHQRVVYAKVSVNQDSKKMDALEDQVNDFYSDNQKKQFVKQNVRGNDLVKIESEINEIKVTADDFNVKKSALPKKTKKLTLRKNKLVKKIDDVSIKLSLQNKINLLFTKNISNWQKFDDSMVIKDDLSVDQLNNIFDEIDYFPKSDWKSIMQKYGELASNQFKLVEKVKKSIKKYRKETITYDQFLKIKYQIDQIGNEKIRDSFKKDMDSFAERVGADNDIEENVESDNVVDNSTTTEEDVGAEEENY